LSGLTLAERAEVDRAVAAVSARRPEIDGQARLAAEDGPLGREEGRKDVVAVTDHREEQRAHGGAGMPEATEKLVSVEAWRTGDGRVFTDRGDAIRHAAELDFLEWYEAHKLYGGFDGCRIEGSEFVDWLSENRGSLAKLLKMLA
jgi:hypothetical protein